MNYIKYLKSLIYILVPILVLNTILSILYYFNIVGNGISNYAKLFIIAISMLIGGIYIGSKTSKKGWLEGLKIGLEVIVLLFIIKWNCSEKGKYKIFLLSWIPFVLVTPLLYGKIVEIC